MRQITCVLVGMFLFAGCATLGIKPSAPVQITFEIEKPFDAVWETAKTALTERGLPVEHEKKDSGLMVTGVVKLEEGFFTDHKVKSVAKRPSVYGGEWTKSRYSVSILAQAIDDNKTKIKIIAFIEAYEKKQTKRWHGCETIGKIEKEVYDSIVLKLK